MMKNSKKPPEKNDLFFNSGILKIGATIFYPAHKKDKNPAILFVHGLTSKRERSFQYAKALSELGYVCLLFDMRGHGTSEGDINVFKLKEFLDDVIAAYDYLSDINIVDKKNISAIGSSFGGYLVAVLSRKRKIKNLALRFPADYPNEAFNKPKANFSSDNKEVMVFRNKARKPQESYALEALQEFEGNVLIIEAEKDDLISHQTILNYLNAVRNKNKISYVVMKDAPHSIREGKFRDDVEKILTEWFSKWL